MKRSLIALAILTFGTGGANATDCAAPTLRNSLAMDRMPGSDLMTVTADVDGSAEKLLIGIADTTQLWNAQAAKLELPVREGRRMMDGGGRFSEDVARVQDLTLSAMRTGNFDTQVSADPAFAGSDGILGTDMMQRFDIDLDFARGRLNYFTPEQCQGAGVYWSPAKVTSVPMEAYANRVYVKIVLDGRAIIAALDTTADRTFLNPKVAAELFGLDPAALPAGTVRDSGALLKAGMGRFSNLSFAGLSFRNPEIAVPLDILSKDTKEFHARKTARDQYHLSEFLPDMIIGMDVLKQSHLYISFQNQRVYVSPAGDGPPLAPQPLETRWFNVWKYGYDTFLYPRRRPFFAL